MTIAWRFWFRGSAFELGIIDELFRWMTLKVCGRQNWTEVYIVVVLLLFGFVLKWVWVLVHLNASVGTHPDEDRWRWLPLDGLPWRCERFQSHLGSRSMRSNTWKPQSAWMDRLRKRFHSTFRRRKSKTNQSRESKRKKPALAWIEITLDRSVWLAWATKIIFNRKWFTPKRFIPMSKSCGRTESVGDRAHCNSLNMEMGLHATCARRIVFFFFCLVCLCLSLWLWMTKACLGHGWISCHTNKLRTHFWPYFEVFLFKKTNDFHLRLGGGCLDNGYFWIFYRFMNHSPIKTIYDADVVAANDVLLDGNSLNGHFSGSESIRVAFGELSLN